MRSGYHTVQYDTAPIYIPPGRQRIIYRHTVHWVAPPTSNLTSEPDGLRWCMTADRTRNANLLETWIRVDTRVCQEYCKQVCYASQVGVRSHRHSSISQAQQHITVTGPAAYSTATPDDDPSLIFICRSSTYSSLLADAFINGNFHQMILSTDYTIRGVHHRRTRSSEDPQRVVGLKGAHHGQELLVGWGVSCV